MKSKFYISWPITNANFFSFERKKIDIHHNLANFFPLSGHTVGCGMTVSVGSLILVDCIFCWIFGVIYTKFTQMFNFWISRLTVSWLVSWLEYWNVQKSTITFFSRNTVGRKRNETKRDKKKRNIYSNLVFISCIRVEAQNLEKLNSIKSGEI